MLIWNTPRLLAIVWYALLFNFAVFPLTNGLLPYVAREIYRIDQTGLGYLVASVSVRRVDRLGRDDALRHPGRAGPAHDWSPP